MSVFDHRRDRSEKIAWAAKIGARRPPGLLVYWRVFQDIAFVESNRSRRSDSVFLRRRGDSQ